jgi:hypothetical protein
VSARATLRQAKWVATELAHFGLDLVEHVVNTWMPSAQSPELRATIAAAGAEEPRPCDTGDCWYDAHGRLCPQRCFDGPGLAKTVRPQPNPQM